MADGRKGSGESVFSTGDVVGPPSVPARYHTDRRERRRAV